MLKKAGIMVAVLLGLVLVIAATKPDTFRVQRTASIKAPPEKIFPLINDFHAWSTWSPYEKLDPSMKRTYAGAPAGQGAVYEWAGNDKAGMGRMEILEAPPPSKVLIKLDFLKPFEGHNTAEFTLVPDGDSATVTWAMGGPANFVSRIMQVFVSMDGLVGKDFVTGLANLKAAAEK